MKPWFKRITVAVAALLALLVALVAGVSLHAGHAYLREWDVPLPDTRAVDDPAIIARGEYLVHGPAHCADCHAPDSAKARMFAGEIVPLTGGTGEITFLGDWTAPNLTPDSATGLGALSDGMIARALRTGVNREGRIALPFKDAYADMAEEDLIAILSYLRSLDAQPGVAPRKDINLLGRITLAYFLRPYGPKNPPIRPRFEPEATVEYGRYIANVTGRCESCHTPRNLKTGAFQGAPFSGGMPFESRMRPGIVYVSPNLTPDSATGVLANLSEDQFVTRIRAGATLPDSPMPWGNYRRMSETDLRALYRYLHSLAPVTRDNGPIVQTVEAFADRARR
ncbi:MAG TPA: cytochrome c [Fibrobacteria bacterium]|nr:cytochrome c [Fibrobacteria bacterium]